MLADISHANAQALLRQRNLLLLLVLGLALLVLLLFGLVGTRIVRLCWRPPVSGGR